MNGHQTDTDKTITDTEGRLSDFTSSSSIFP